MHRSSNCESSKARRSSARVKSRLPRVLAISFSITCLNLMGTMSIATAGPQAVSPSIAPNTHQRNMEAAAGQQSTEPSLQLLSALDTMIPFDVIGSKFEAPLRSVARKFLAGSTEETIAGLEAIRQQRPDFPPPPLLMANMLFAAGSADKSRQWLEKTVLDHPEHPAAYLGFARLSTGDKRFADADAMLARVSSIIDAGTWTEAQQRLFRLEYLDIQADIHINRQQLEEAKQRLVELKSLMPENGKVSIRLAQVEFDLNDVDASLFQLREAIKLGQKVRKPEVVISDWFTRQNKPEESAKWIKLAATEYPTDVSVQIDYGRWLLQKENFAEALTVIENAEKLGCDAYIAGYLKGQLAFAQQRYDQAEALFDDILTNKPNDADATNMLSLSLIESESQQKHERAEELATMNVRLYPKSPTAAATLGWIYYRNGKKQQAEQAFRAVVATGNLAPAAAYYFANFLVELGDLAGAKNLLEKSVASTDYFMFRSAATALLATVKSKMPEAATPNENK